ncbi:immunoglobulin domain-containing protein [Luteolibacter luteus]|uniref:Ig-like domain-containing protein n=1 Tax=Luteolibacter luteus TaxID=2728835 RepID=A0A858RMV6_9BACT|nr:immunoglobulin domain-containing protein [Luteolibacter luteus]QJE97824.1 hypothetical protein HHL09_19225 [Luteolibacter luteus]
MTLTTRLTCTSIASLLAGFTITPSTSEAAQLAYEGFDYAAGAGNLTGNTGGFGWGSVWQTVNNGSADVVDGSLVAGASSPTGYDLLSTGASNNLPSNRRVGRKLDTSASGPFGAAGYRDANGLIGATGKTIYLSFVQQPNGTSAYYEFEFHRGDLGDGGRIGGIGNDQGGDNVNLRAPNGTHTLIGPGTTEANFYVVRIDFKDGNDDVYVYRNPTSLTEPGVPTLTRLGAADMSFDGLSFGAFNNDRTVSHDEVRLGESWADVVVPPVSQPTFAQQPRSSTSYAGGTVELKARASGNPLPSYQWFKGSNPISGATGATLTLSNIQAGDAGLYHVTATNSQNTATSENAQVTVQTTPTGLLAYEGFDYNTGSGNLPGKVGGLGWSAAWTPVNGGGSGVNAGNLAAGSNAPGGYDAQSLGNSNFMPNNQRDGRLLDTSPGGRFGAAGYVDGSGNIGADGKTIYISFLQQPDGTSLFYEFEFHRGDLGDPGRIGGVGNDTMAANVTLRTAGTQTLIGPGSTAVNLYVVRIDFKPGNDDVYVYQNPLSSSEPAIPTLAKIDASDMSFNGISLAAFVNNRTVKHDEIRIGQSWSDVVFGTSRRELTWVGNGTTNAWNTSAANWTAGTGATTFANGDAVTFDDSGSATPAVNVPANVETALLTVNNDTVDYTINGPGSIASSGALTKSGSGALTLNAPASFGNAVVVNNGSLTLGGTATAGGDLKVEFGDTTLSGENTFTGSMSANNGTHVLSGTNTFSGLVGVNANFTITGTTNITGTGGTAIYIGNLGGANSTVTIENGGSLTMTGAFNDAWVIGRDGGSGSFVQNGGTVTYNPTNRGEAFIGAAANGGTTASYEMNGGTLEMSAKRLGLSIGPIVSTLTHNGGAINVRQLDLGANLNSGTGIYNLNNGVITIGAGGITTATQLYEINLAGGTIAAADNWSTLMAMELTTGPVTINTADKKIGLYGALTGTGSLVKNGTGTLVMTGLNDYTGATTINAGTLAGFGNSDQSALSVASGATLAPGDPDSSPIGSFIAPSISLAAGSTLALEIDSTSDFADQVAVMGSMNISGANVSFSEIGAGIVPAGTRLVIIDYSSGSLIGTFAGYPDGATVTVGANTFTLDYTDSNCVTLTSTTTQTPYMAWAESKGLDDSPGKESGFDVDPDQDGIANGLEWVLGGDPLANDAASLVTVAGSAANGLTLSFTREESSIGNVLLDVQWDADLDGNWTDVPVTQAGGPAANGVTVTVNQAATPDTVEVHIPASNAVGGKLFGRFHANEP